MMQYQLTVASAQSFSTQLISMVVMTTFIFNLVAMKDGIQNGDRVGIQNGDGVSAVALSRILFPQTLADQVVKPLSRALTLTKLLY